MTINVKHASAFPSSTFSTSSTSYVDLLNGSGGSTIAVTITKGAGTDILIRAGAVMIGVAGSATVTLGVNDGTTDYALGRTISNDVLHRHQVGDRLITGLGAGTFTFTLRVKITANSLTFNGNHNAFITAMEVDHQSVNAKATAHLFPSNFTLTSTSFTDLLQSAGGSPIDVTITKGAGTDLLVYGVCSSIQNGANDNLTLAVNDGTTDYTLGRNRLFSAKHNPVAGGVVITGLGAGTYTLKLRVKLGAGNQCNFTGNQDSASLMVMEIAP